MRPRRGLEGPGTSHTDVTWWIFTRFIPGLIPPPTAHHEAPSPSPNFGFPSSNTLPFCTDDIGSNLQHHPDIGCRLKAYFWVIEARPPHDLLHDTEAFPSCKRKHRISGIPSDLKPSQVLSDTGNVSSVGPCDIHPPLMAKQPAVHELPSTRVRSANIKVSCPLTSLLIHPPLLAFFSPPHPPDLLRLLRFFYIYLCNLLALFPTLFIPHTMVATTRTRNRNTHPAIPVMTVAAQEKAGIRTRQRPKCHELKKCLPRFTRLFKRFVT